MEDDKFCKSSKNLIVDKSISKTHTHIRNNLSQNEIDDKNTLFNFLTSKQKITLKSCFDHKGAKKFLSEKEKAMASFELSDDIIEEKRKKKRRSRKSVRKNKSKNKYRSESQKALINVKARKSKNINVDKKELRRKKMSDKTVSLDFAENYQRHMERKLTINSDFSNIKVKDSLNLASNHNDSFIYSILKEMAEVKH